MERQRFPNVTVTDMKSTMITREVLTKNGMVLSGLSPDGRIVEMIELKEHPFFVATQAHPEFKSRPNLPHPLFKGFVKAAVAYEAAGSSAV